MRVAVFRALLIGCVAAVEANAFGGMGPIARTPVVDGSPVAMAVMWDHSDSLRRRADSSPLLQIIFDREVVAPAPLGMPDIPPARQVEFQSAGIQQGSIDASMPPAVLLEPLATARPHDRVTIEPSDPSWETESIAAPLPAPLWPPLIVFAAAWVSRTFRKVRI